MRRVIGFCQVLEIKSRVNLRGADVGVAQQFLHGAQVLRRFQQVRCERVPEHVRMHVLGQSLQPGPAGNAPLHDARPEPPEGGTPNSPIDTFVRAKLAEKKVNPILLFLSYLWGPMPIMIWIA